MANQVHVKLPAAVYQRLKRFAKEERRSMQNAATVLLERALEERDHYQGQAEEVAR
jgi:hypothetical protein